MSLFIDTPSDPIAAFDTWLQEAGKTEPNDPNAMALATVGADGMPNARMVLFKGHDARGLFFTPICKAKRAMNWMTMPKRRWFFIGRHCSVKCACMGLFRRSLMMRQTLIISRVGGRAALALGLRSNRALWLTAPNWKRPMAKWTPHIRVRIFHARRIGRGGASRHYVLSFGKMATIACMTGWSSNAPAPKPLGKTNGFILNSPPAQSSYSRYSPAFWRRRAGFYPHRLGR